MPLTNAEKQKAHRHRQREKIARMEKALQAIVYEAERENGGWVHLKRLIGITAKKALDPSYTQPKYFD